MRFSDSRTMTRHFSTGWVVCVGLMTSTATAQASQVKGVIEYPAAERTATDMSYTRSRIAMPAQSSVDQRGEAAIFLAVKESLPTPPPTAVWKVVVAGMRLAPSVVACAVDESVEFVNGEKIPVTVQFGTETLATLAPGASKSIKCASAGDHRVRVEEMPHLRGMVHIGALGISAIPDKRGAFSIKAPQGTYELRVIGVHGVSLSRVVKVEKSDVDLAVIKSSHAEASKAGSGKRKRPTQLRSVKKHGEGQPNADGTEP